MKALLPLLSALLLCTATLQARDTEKQNKVIDKVGFTQNLNEQLPLDATFLDEAGQTVTLGQYFKRKPVLLNFVYFKCPMLCTEVLNGVIRGLRGMSLSVGKDFNVVTISIDPREGPQLAAAKKRLYWERYNRKNGDPADWAFLTGQEASIKRVADAAGFHYAYDREIDEYAHASGIVIVTPQGVISRYYYGVEYPERELRLSLVEASSGHIGTAVDRFLLYCYRYDPETGRYGVLIMRILRVASACTAALLLTFVVVMIRRERKPA